MAWSIQASGHAVSPEDEHNLYLNLQNVFVNPAYGVSASQFAGEHTAGTPGLPEPEPEPALPTLSPEAQADALAEENAHLRAQLALENANLRAQLAALQSGGLPS